MWFILYADTKILIVSFPKLKFYVESKEVKLYITNYTIVNVEFRKMKHVMTNASSLRNFQTWVFWDLLRQNIFWSIYCPPRTWGYLFIVFVVKFVDVGILINENTRIYWIHYTLRLYVNIKIIQLFEIYVYYWNLNCFSVYVYFSIVHIVYIPIH